MHGGSDGSTGHSTSFQGHRNESKLGVGMGMGMGVGVGMGVSVGVIVGVCVLRQRCTTQRRT